MSKLSAMTALRSLLHEMEADLGLPELSTAEMDVLLAAHAVTSKSGDIVTSDQIRNHDLVSKVTQSTYHRAVRTLLDLGLLHKAKGFKSRRYIVREDLV